MQLFIIEQNLVGISAVVLVMFYHRLEIRHDMLGQYVKTWSSTKPEVHNILQRQHRRTYVAICNMHKKLAKYGHVVFKLCKWTEEQTDILITILCNKNWHAVGVEQPVNSLSNHYN